jgi:uncharacterized membrane protein YraQ (UPF0718 family)
MRVSIFHTATTKHLLPDGFIIRFLGQRRKLTLVFAVLAGFLMAACSHGILDALFNQL